MWLSSVKSRQNKFVKKSLGTPTRKLELRIIFNKSYEANLHSDRSWGSAPTCWPILLNFTSYANMKIWRFIICVKGQRWNFQVEFLGRRWWYWWQSAVSMVAPIFFDYCAASFLCVPDAFFWPQNVHHEIRVKMNSITQPLTINIT